MLTARLAGASTTLATGEKRLTAGSTARLPLRLTRSGHILKRAGNLRGRLTVTVGSDGLAGQARGTYRP